MDFVFHKKKTTLIKFRNISACYTRKHATLLSVPVLIQESTQVVYIKASVVKKRKFCVK